MTTRISKACHECRARKIRCDGQQPCRHCTLRGTSCVYRVKARSRRRKPDDATREGEPSLHVDRTDDAASAASAGSQFGDDREINIHSVTATHRASASCTVQLYYGPSSVFSLMNSIYHEIEGTRPSSPSRQAVEEIGPGLDLFSHRRLFFGDVAGTQDASQNAADENSVMFLDPVSAERFLERYLATFWHFVPVVPKAHFYESLRGMFASRAPFSFDTPEKIILAVALAMGANLLGEEATCGFLFQRARQGATKLDEVVNTHMILVYIMMSQLQIERARPNSGFLHIGSAARRAAAAGLHKETSARRSDAEDGGESEQKIILFWSLYCWDTWVSFSLGRQAFMIDPGETSALPRNQKHLCALVHMSRIVSKCVERIYAPRHNSIVPVWKAATEIRADLIQFAKEEPPELGFNVTGPVAQGEMGHCQSILAAMYHHTLQLTFRPFLILRAKMRKRNHMDASVSPPPAWLDKGCEYCLSAAKDTISFLLSACRENEICRETKYHNFFAEAACFTLAFDLMQDNDGSYRNLPWIQSSIQCLRLLLPGRSSDSVQTDVTIAAFERMVRTVIPNFTADAPVESLSQFTSPSWRSEHGSVSTGMYENNNASMLGAGYSSVRNGSLPGDAQMAPEFRDGQMLDMTASDLGLNFDFGTMDMDAFLSIDSSQDWLFRPQ